VVVAAVDSNNGDYIAYTEKNTPVEEMPLRYLASASVPFVFPHQLIQGRTMMDGGTVWNTNLASAVDRCREIVDRDEDIIMDVIICSDGKLDTMNTTGDTIENFLRSFTVSGYHKSLEDVREFRRSMPNVTYRYFFMASKPLSSVFELLEFNLAVIQPMIDIGKEDAKTIVTTTKPGESFKKVDDWVDSPHIRAEYPNLAHYLYGKKPEASTI
jgi:predicted patatin/cPLA2 family phospholipase